MAMAMSRRSCKSVMADQGLVTGMEKIITKPGQAPVHFVSGLDECEKKTVVWEILNLAELLEMSEEKLKENGITFDVGHAIGIPATWHFYFCRYEGTQRIVNVLKLSTDSKAKLVTASCSLSVSYGDKTIGPVELQHEQFNNPGSKDRYKYGFGRGWPLLLSRRGLLEKTDNGQKALTVTLVLQVASSQGQGPASLKIPSEKPLKRKAQEAIEVVWDLGKLLESGDGGDVDVSVPSELDASSYTRKAHKAILMGRSTVFSKMFAKGSEMVEAKTGKVVIEDLSPQGLDIFLRYLYTGKVLDEWVKVPEEILNTAEKHGLEGLKQYCGENLISAVTTSNAREILQLAKFYNLPSAFGDIEEFISKNC